MTDPSGPDPEPDVLADARLPVTDTRRKAPREGIALCLSGGGYRAMLFHCGALVRLNELGYLPRLERISSVSGGSITAAKLGLEWSELTFEDDVATDLTERVIRPIRRLAGKTIDVGAVLTGILVPGRTVADRAANAYAAEWLLGDNTLEKLPTDSDGPRFVINATNVRSGKLVRFSHPYVADYTVGKWNNPTTRLADAVAASAAFPPVLSPHRVAVTGEYEADSGPAEWRSQEDWVVSDGGVYDNLGLETAWKSYQTVLVSDGGGALTADPKPKSDWARHGLRVVSIVDGQVRALRKRQLIAGYIGSPPAREGTYWSVRSDQDKYGLASAVAFRQEGTIHPADVNTRLAKLEPETQRDLLRWGYVICDTAMRRWVETNAQPPAVPDLR